MAKCVVGSMGSLFWATTFLTLMLMMGALVFVQGMASYRMDNPERHHEQCDAIEPMFGSVLAAMITLLQTTTGGCDWGDVYDVVRLSGTFNNVLFLSFIIFFTFSFFNIVMSLFVEKAM